MVRSLRRNSSKSQEEILLTLVQHRGGDGNNHDRGQDWASKRVGWNDPNSNSNDDSSSSACQWEGIECNADNQVIALLVANSQLSVSIPTELGQLTTLERIQMQGNSLYGTIPNELSSLPHLEWLDLSQNRLTGTLPQMFTSKYLDILHLDRNDLYGTIPSGDDNDDDNVPFIASNRIQDLSLFANRLSGSIPTSLLQLTSLDTLNLSFNQLDGTIPAEIGNLSLLQYLHLDNNNFVGFIPSSIAKYHKIPYDETERNTTPNEQNYLISCTLENNRLSGEIPIQFAELVNLQSFLLYDNKLTGMIPTDLCSDKMNVKFFGAMPSEQDKNYCDAISCPIDSVASAGNTYPCTKCYNVHYNPYIGQTGSCNTATSQRDIVTIVHHDTTVHGSWNDKVENDNDENIPWDDEEEFLCDYTGITCDESNHIVEINLRGRELSGTIPSQIGFLKYLQVLDLSDNHLSGYLPSDLRWAPLKQLDISGNHIKGIVPPILCLKSNVNGNGHDGDYNCDFISCPAGTYSSTGRQTSNEKCRECYHPKGSVTFNMLGSKECKSLGMRSGIFGLIVSISTFVFATSMFFILRYKRKTQLVSLSTHNPQYLNDYRHDSADGAVDSSTQESATAHEDLNHNDDDDEIVNDSIKNQEGISTKASKKIRPPIFSSKKRKPSRAARKAYEPIISSSDQDNDTPYSKASDTSSQSGSMRSEPDSASTTSHHDASTSKSIELTSRHDSKVAGDNISVVSGSSSSKHGRRRKEGHHDMRSVASDESNSKQEQIWLDVPDIS